MHVLALWAHMWGCFSSIWLYFRGSGSLLWLFFYKPHMAGHDARAAMPH